MSDRDEPDETERADVDGYQALLATLDAWFAAAREAAGPGVIPCRRGCGACCLGLFDISPADASLVRAGVAALPPAEREALRSRAADQLRRYAELLPTWGAPWDVDELPEEVFDALTEQLARAPCPALDPQAGCMIYAHRPATCRMTGLAMDAGDAGRLDNECPIQADFPRYSALPATPFDLLAFEARALRHDALAAARGERTTTVAAACAPISGGSAARP